MDLPELQLATTAADIDAAVLAVPVFRGAIAAPGADIALEALGLGEVPRSTDFTGRPGEVLQVANPGGSHPRVAFVGLGRLDELRPEQLRRAAGALARQLLGTAESLVTTLPLVDPTAAHVRATAEGLLLGAHRDDRWHTEPAPRRLRTATLVVPSSLEEAAARSLELARVHATAQLRSRDLVTTPATDLGPEQVVDWARQTLTDGQQIEVWEPDRLAEERCGAILGVGQGSSRPPRLLVVRHEPPNPIARIALVGKGITFDSGGLSLKPPKGQEHMKHDMAGAAAVLAVMGALPALATNVAVTAWCPLAENMPSGGAQRPSDVVATRNGTTVQVLNTDAEGRLVMADALALAAEEEPDGILDVATLTGAVRHAIGRRAFGVFGNDDDLLRQLIAAAEEAGEAAWHLPLWEDLREGLDSEVADLDNVFSGDDGGATIAGLFLREFVDELPWVHLDIAGANWASSARGHLPEQATGVGVRTILHWLEAARS